MRVVKRILVVLVILALLVAGTAAVLWSMAQSEPEFYRELAVTPQNTAQARADSDSMLRKVGGLRRHIRMHSQWTFACTQQELNHWLAVYIQENHPGMIPRQLKHPRGRIRDGEIHAGVTLDTREYKGVLSIDCVPSVKEPNVLEAEIQTVRLGKAPVPMPAFRKIVTEIARQYRLPVEWGETDGRQVLRLRLQDGDIRYDGRDIVVESIELRDGNLLLTGVAHMAE